MKASMILSLGVVAAVSAHKNETLTTSTVYATNVYTVTSCAPTVTNCPVGHVTTEIIVDYTTVCPVAATETTPPPYPTSHPAGPSTSTLYSTEVITISKCAPTVTDCPYTTKPILSTTIYTYPAGPNTHPAPESTPVGPGSSLSPPVPTTKPAGPENSPAPSSPATSPAPVISTITISTCIPTQIISVITVTPSVTKTYVPTSAPSAVIPKPPTNSTVPFTGGASAQKAGGLLMAAGLVAALL